MKNSFFVIPFMLMVALGFGQDESDDNSDFEAWTSIGLDYELNKKWSFGLEEQLRLKTNASEIDKYFTQLEAKYQVFKNFDVGGGLRYIRNNDNQGNIQGYENFFRFQLDASYKQKINDFTLKYRLRYQNKNELGVAASEGDYANQNVRFKTSVGYNIKGWKLDPKFSAEIFNRFEKGEENGFNKYRLTLGTDYKMKKLGKISLFFRMEKELNVDFPKTTNILGLKYVYTIKNKE